MNLRLRAISTAIFYTYIGVSLLYSNAYAESASVTLTAAPKNEFTVPPALRPRVEFWKAVFTKYGKHQALVHHRLYPQVVFKVLDFSQVAEQLSPREYEKLRKKVTDERVAEVEQIMRNLATGALPATPYEQKVAQVMATVPGGLEKYDQAVKDQLIRTQTGIKERYREAVMRAGRYLPVIEDIFVNQYQLPKELTRLPFVESSFDYQAYSVVGAAGIWQFMPRTGRLYMTINKQIDERRDVAESSKAAARYLSDAYGRLGSWPLALTSYNHGVAGVMNKVKLMGTTDIAELIETPTKRPFGFASENFYPEFLAAVEIYGDYQKYFPGLVLEPALKIAQIRITKPTSVAFVSKQLNLPIEEIKRYNYAIGATVWSGKQRIPSGYILKIPAASQQYASRLAQPEVGTQQAVPPASVVSGGTTYLVRKGDTVVKLAKKFGVTVAQLTEQNNVKGRALKVGEMLTINHEEQRTPAKSSQKTTGVKKVAQPVAHTSSYTVKVGDTLWSISKKTGKSVEALRKANKIKGNAVVAGKKLIVP